MGITFLAAGTSVPEAVSSVIVAKQGNHMIKNFSFVFILGNSMMCISQSQLTQSKI